MNRFRHGITGCACIAVLFAVAALVSSLAPVVFAGDYDGLGGYRMQLKNKDAGGNEEETGGAGPGTYLGEQGSSTAPASPSDQSAEDSREVLFTRIALYFSLLLRMR